MKIRNWGMVGVAVWSSLLMSFTTGCASGGWKTTRTYARFVNKQPIIIRIILYILTLVVFAVTAILDAVIFNTQDFWNGTVSAGSYKFEKDGLEFVAEHSYQNGSRLRQSRLSSFRGGKKLDEILLRETPEKEIEIHVNGVFKARVNDIFAAPTLSYYDAQGISTQSSPMFLDVLTASNTRL